MLYLNCNPFVLFFPVFFGFCGHFWFVCGISLFWIFQVLLCTFCFVAWVLNALFCTILLCVFLVECRIFCVFLDIFDLFLMIFDPRFFCFPGSDTSSVFIFGDSGSSASPSRLKTRTKTTKNRQLCPISDFSKKKRGRTPRDKHTPSNEGGKKLTIWGMAVRLLSPRSHCLRPGESTTFLIGHFPGGG